MDPNEQSLPIPLTKLTLARIHGCSGFQQRKQMPLHKAGVSQWWTYALTLVYSTLPPLPTPPQQRKTHPNINAGWCCSAIGDVAPITVSDYAFQVPNCTLNNMMNGSKLMGGLMDWEQNKNARLQKHGEWCLGCLCCYCYASKLTNTFCLHSCLCHR